MRKPGRIKSKPPNMLIAGNIIAARVAGMVAPDNANDIFTMLKGITGDRYNSHSRMPTSMSYASTSKFGTSLSSAFKDSLNSETRDQMAARMGLQLPNLAYAPKKGIGTAAQTKPRTGEQQQREFSDYQTYGASGNTQQQQTSDPNMVDDAGWSKTLAQTVGSGMLSAAQLKAASFENVSTMIGHRTAGFNGAVSGQLSQNEKKEMTFMLQRMILEGYTKGVDIPAMIKNMSGSQLKMSTSDGSGLGLGVAGYNIGAMFDKTWWSKASDIDKIGLFYQEIGHALGVAAHTRGLMDGKDTIFSADETAKANYSRYVDYYFQDVKSESKYDIAASNQDALSSSAAAELIKANPSWLPSLSGASIPTVRNVSVPNVSTRSNVAFTPGTVPLMGPESEQAGASEASADIAMPSSELSESVSTPTKTFAAGMADLSTPNEPSQMDNAGTLLRHG